MSINILNTDNSDLNIINQAHYSINNDKKDYKNKVCKKPWGYEYLCFESDKIGIWQLRIYNNNKTSLHTHFKKDTILLVLSGKVKLNMINDYKIFETLDLIYIPKKKFHGIEPISNYIDILEIEIFDKDTNFSNKNDLFRLIDGYIRDKNYENSIEIIENDLLKFNHFYFDNIKQNNLSNKFDDTNLLINNNFIKNDNEYSENNYYILLKNEIFFNNKIYKEGSIFNNKEFFIKDFQKIVNKNKNIFLTLENNYLEKNKIIYNNLELEYITHKYKKLNKKLILTSGCFDILHIGHIELLKHAKKLGDKLIVCLSKDEQIKILKGNDRPINSNNDRLNLFITIKYVDYVYLYSENNTNNNEEKLDEIMNIVDPHYWVKGNDYNKEDILKKHPKLKNIELINLIKDKSTTNIINIIKNS